MRRLQWAVERLQVQPADAVLEIGCGGGVAAELVCEGLDGGRLTALDRSATAVAAARRRLAGQAAVGTVRVEAVSLEDADLARLGPFDKVLAVNVNLFWVRRAAAELGSIAGALRPGGRLLLVYEPPDVQRLARLQTTLLRNLHAAGYRCSTETDAANHPALLAVTAEPVPHS